MKLILVPVAAFLGFLLALLLVLVRQGAKQKLGIISAQLAAYRRGDYEEQLRIVEGFRTNGSEPPDYLFFHGAACYQLGRLEEAERALRRSLSMETRPQLRTPCRDELGRVLMAQERWDEAEACFRECIAESPSRGAGPRALAELILRRGGQAQAALEAARSAVAMDRVAKTDRTALGKEAYALELSESLALLAWALAENHAGLTEIRKALDEAFPLCPPATKPIFAELHYFAGQAFAALGDRSESSRHFQTAAETDPAGNYGRLARQLVTAPSGI